MPHPRPLLSAFCFLLAFAVGIASAAANGDTSTNDQANSPIPVTNEIDLVEAKINALNLKDLTLDRITDLFGRPDAVSDPQEIDQIETLVRYFGPTLYYHGKGLKFNFFHPAQDKERHLQSLEIYLSKVWDKKYVTFYLPYDGHLSRNVDANWKATNVFAIFSDLKPQDLYETDRPEREKLNILAHNAEALQKQSPVPGLADPFISVAASMEQNDCAVVIHLKSHHLRFDYEKNTKFIERIDVLLLK